MNLSKNFQIFDFNCVKQKYLAKSPLTKWIYVRQLNVFLMKLVGVEFMESNYEFNWKTWIPMYLGVNFFGLMVYTGYYYSNQPFRALQPTVITGIMVPVSVHTVTKCSYSKILL